MFIFWYCFLILRTQSLVNSFEELAEDPVIDSFDFALHNHERKMKTRSSGKQQTDEWVDPFDMVYYSHQQKRMVNEEFLQNGKTNSDSEMGKDSKDIKAAEGHHSERSKMEKNFLMRFVNLLINHCESGEEDLPQGTSIMLKISQAQLQDLRRLRDSGESEAIIRLLNGITSHMTTTSDGPDMFTKLFISDEIWSNIGAASFALIPLCIFILHGSMRKVTCVLALAVFAVGYFKTYKLMLKKVELQNENTLATNTDCNVRERSWYQMIFGSKTDDECLKQLHAMNIDPSLEVTPVHVISHMLAVAGFQPFEYFSVMFSRLSKQILESHSILSGWLVLVIAVGIIMYIITLCYAGIFGKNLSVGNRHVSVGITGTAHSNTKMINTSSENSSDHQVATGQKAEVSRVKHEYTHQPVIQIIHNYSSNNLDKSAVQHDCTAEQSVCEKGTESSRDMNSLKNQGEPHEGVKGEEPDKIHEVMKREKLGKILEVVKGEELDKILEVMKGQEVTEGEDAHKVHVIVKENSTARQDTV